MAETPDRAALKGARRTMVIVIIVAVAVSAVLGIAILLTGGWGDVQGRVLGTTLAVAVFAVTALCHLAQVDRPLRAVGFAGIAASVLAVIPIITIIWAEEWLYTSDAYLWLVKAFALFGILAGSLAQANLLLLLARRRQPAVRVVLAVALVVIAALAVMILLPILSDGEIPGSEDTDWYWRLFGVIAIVDALCTIVLPVLGLVLKDARAGFVSLGLQVPSEIAALLDERAAADGSTRVAVAEAALARGLEPSATTTAVPRVDEGRSRPGTADSMERESTCPPCAQPSSRRRVSTSRSRICRFPSRVRVRCGSRSSRAACVTRTCTS